MPSSTGIWMSMIDDVGIGLGDEVQRGAAVLGGAHDLEPVERRQQGDQTLPQDGVVVDDGHPDRGAVLSGAVMAAPQG